jgi:hypothetical protein
MVSGTDDSTRRSGSEPIDRDTTITPTVSPVDDDGPSGSPCLTVVDGLDALRSLSVRLDEAGRLSRPAVLTVRLDRAVCLARVS